jgi:hypothetical protein
MNPGIHCLPALALASLMALPVASAQAQSTCLVAPPPARLNLDPFYKKYCVAAGIGIGSSGQVPDAALKAAAGVVSQMLTPMPAVRDRLLAAGVRVAIIGEHEVTTDIPEYKELRRKFPNVDYDRATRGLGATEASPVSSGAEENLLCYPTDRYRGENIFVHEFSHTIKRLGIQYLDPGFRARVQLAYDHAKAAGLWEKTYSMANAEEYWAEGVQSYFDANRMVDPPNGIHNAIGTRAKLKDYDPELFGLLDRAFGSTPWRPHCP